MSYLSSYAQDDFRLTNLSSDSAETVYRQRRDHEKRITTSNESPVSSKYFDNYPKKSNTSQEHSHWSSELGELNGPHTRHKLKSRSLGKTRDGRVKNEDAEGDDDRHHAFPALSPELDDWSPEHSVDLVPNPTQDDEHWRVSKLPTQHSSGSSTFTRAETPPYTPIDAISVRGMINIIHVVAAPVAGVETMDALVEGMNGFDDDDFYKRPGIGSRAGKIGHHPLYHPPLPTPPPGIVLGHASPRKDYTPKSQLDGDIGDNSDLSEDLSTEVKHISSPNPYVKLETLSTSPSRPISLLEHPEPVLKDHTVKDMIQKSTSSTNQKRAKTVVPSISEIIRKNALPARARLSIAQSSSQGHAILQEESEPEPEPLSAAEEAELLSRSSIDSVAEEVQQTLLKQGLPIIKNSPPHPRHSYTNPRQTSETSSSPTLFKSSRSDHHRESSIYSSSASTVPSLSPSPINDIKFISDKKQTAKEQIAKYLRSKKMTTLLRLTRSPHASVEQPLTVSLCDLGSPTGFPLVIFLGLGCVRYVMGLYDEMAECLGLRLIAIDRWGLGRTSTPKSEVRGIPEWATVVDEVLELLHIERCSVMAHSAGAPYALSFSNRYPNRVKGDVCLLAPWVGGGEAGSYKWLKYIPSGLLKTAQAAEWKVQAWMIGKPPTITYEPVGYNVKTSLPSVSSPVHSRPSTAKSARNAPESCLKASSEVYPSASLTRDRPSLSSGSFSEYDDLKDFGGRFESRSTLGPRNRMQSPSEVSDREEEAISMTKSPIIKKRKSKSLLRILKGSTNTTETPVESKNSFSKRLKAPRSAVSLRSRSKKASMTDMARVSSDKPQSPPIPLLSKDRTLIDGSNILNPDSTPIAYMHSRMNSHSTSVTDSGHNYGASIPTRTGGRRSVSFTASTSSRSFMSSPPLRSASAMTVSTDSSLGSSYQTALGNALIAASHAESSKGTHNDLLQILNHERKPWGFSYNHYPHKVRVWYGDKDERIAENAIRWMERNMGENMCKVVVVKGADHGLLYRSSVVVDVLECVRAFWSDSKF